MTGSSVLELASRVGAELVGDGTVVVDDVTHDSRQVKTGTLFVAIRGATSDGHRFVDNAVGSGAGAVCVEQPMNVTVPQLIVPDTRRAMGPLAAIVHGDPSRHMKLIGVTGTNGKTTVTHFIESLVRGSGLTCGLIGTIETRVGDHTFKSERTTPESSDFQRLLGEMRDMGCALVAAEVSSHALSLARVLGTRFEVVAFTNLSQDHLDFHGDMESYLAAKETLFTEYEYATAVVNIDDPVGPGLASRAEGKVITVGPDGDARGANRVPSATGTSFDLITPWGSDRVELALVGSFNVDNAVMAAVCALAAGLRFDDVISGLHTLTGVPGRFEKVSGDDPVTVIVDYAHTPEGVRLTVENARNLNPERLIALVGAGGDRDRDKRPIMGAEVAAADLAVITSDNPRSEDPEEIIRSVVAGVPEGTEMIVEVDRRKAIELAIRAASPGDIVLLLGRGHEPNQEIGGQFIPFDDRAVAREALAGLRSSTNSGENDMRIRP